MAAAAGEVFPKECCGFLCSDAGTVVAMPFQLATRRNDEVASASYDLFENWFHRGPKPIGSFHSHTKPSKKVMTYWAPSETDLENMVVGDMEVIICIRKAKNNWQFEARQHRTGILVGIGKFRMAMHCFARIIGFNKNCIPKYKLVPMRLQ
jgi:proteasome lid subunit RPN8/RPN11